MTSEIVRVKAFNNTAWVREEAGYNGKLYFQAAPDHGTTIYEDGQTHTAVIWETDGTEEGTKILYDFAPGPIKFVPSHIRTANNHLFFEIRIDEGSSRYELWSYKTNPQDPGKESSLTRLVYSLDGRFPDSRFDDNIEATKNGLFFLQTDENDLNELWFTNGSSGPENTYSLGGNEPGKPGSNFVRLVGADNRLYFIADGREAVPGSDEPVYDPNELWSTTSQPGTFKKLSDFDTTCSASFCSPINHEKAIGDALYFTGRTEIDTGDTSGIYDRYVDDIEPWVSQGSDQTTRQIADVNPFRNSFNVPSGTISSQFTSFNGEIYFLGINNRDFNEDPSETLYAYSPESGIVRAVAQTAEEWRNHSYRELFVFNGFLYFSGQTEETGWELWRSDGTSQGTRFLKDIKSNGSSSSHPQDFTIHKKDRTLYSADDDDLYFHTEYGSVWKLSGQSGLIDEVEVDDSLWQGAGNITSVDLANGSTDLYFTSGQTIFTLADQIVEEPENKGCIDVFRFYNPNNSVHFFTTSTTEKDNLISKPEWGYRYEGVAYESPTTAGDQLYRFFHREKGYHFMTADPAEADFITGKPEWGYNYEGRGFRVSQTQTETTPVEIYRFYHAGKGIHFYSASETEANNVIANSLGESYNLENARNHDNLLTGGWGYIYEGIAWYASNC